MRRGSRGAEVYFQQFYDHDLAQGSYLIGCQASGEAVVVDPRRDVRVYLEAAAAEGLRIVAVTDTHIHADYVSGARELAAAAGAELYLSDEGGPDWRYAFDHRGLTHGSVIRVGNVTLEALHTPGHTPEHLALLVTDGARSALPSHLLSGDFVFVGDVGRPDLLDAVAGGAGTRFEGARRLFASLRDRFLTLPDHVQVWPGHGAGSACGKALGAVASSTVGFERLTAWWAPYLAAGDEAGFTTALLEGQPDAPTYFGRMKRVNRDGPPVLGDRGPLRRLSSGELRGRVNRDLVLVDTRTVAEQRSGSVAGALAVPGGASFATYAAWVIDPDVETREIVLLATGAEHARALSERLTRVGIDGARGYLTSVEGLEVAPLPLLRPEGGDALAGADVLDVRTASEHAAKHLPGARQIAAGNVLARLQELPRGRRLVVHCQGGGRAAAVASALRNRGFANVVELDGSLDVWLERVGHAPGGAAPSGGAMAGGAEGVSAT